MNDTRKAPAWARQRIELLERDLESAKAEIRMLTGPIEASRVRIEDSLEKPVPIPENRRVVFEQEHGVIEVYLSRQDGDVRVRSNSGPGQRLVVLPEVTNVVRLAFRED